MKLTPLEIEQQAFKICFRGFDRHEVDRFLEQAADTVAGLQGTLKHQDETIQQLKLEVQGYREREETFKRMMLNSQKVVAQMKENARKSAEIIVADAEVKAEKILNRAHGRLSQLHGDIAELKRQRIQIETQIQSVIDAHAKLLESCREGMEAMDVEDTKIRLINH
ncbi:DivIVA domain-containing protein [Desulfosarcina sp. OttesenSCG-928-G10]|nr:DivIVA domain-containing protein [Desulfosarcina sp. OttesenSCG-928-G10]MDL2321164.1 DivIVA domain-containing protein [Desulfosarcina sp. OttesenSCG-928-B08]